MQIQGIYKSDKEKSIFYTWNQAMHTRIDVVLCDRSEIKSKQIAARIYEEINRIEKTGNRFDPESEISMINQTASKQPVILSADLFEIISLCMEYHKQTNGLFDITIQSENYNKNTISSVILNPGKGTIYFQEEGIKIDLCGFLKGYALEKIRPILQEERIEDALINFGNSSVMAIGNHPFGKGWKIKTSTLSEKEDSVTLFNECFTTSGNSVTGRQHIINPETGEYIEGIRTVSVITEKATEGEAFSTASFIATPEQQKELIENKLHITFR